MGDQIIGIIGIFQPDNHILHVYIVRPRMSPY
jgi:hypothetical protein